MTIIFCFLITSIIIYFILEKKKIYIFINQVIKQRFGENKNFSSSGKNKENNKGESDLNLKKMKKRKKFNKNRISENKYSIL